MVIMAKKILVAEDDNNIRELIALYLNREGYDIVPASDGEEALRVFARERPDLVLLDVMMPNLDGFQVCKKIRETSKTPVIMLTAKGETFDKVSGLEIGADDYIVKPFEMREVIARISAVLRRVSDEKPPMVINMDNLTIDKEAYELKVNGEIIDAPPKEIELLFFLASKPNRVFTRAQLLDDVWGFDYCGDTRTVDVHIKRLRGKINGASDKWELKTVWGVGYKFELPDVQRQAD